MTLRGRAKEALILDIAQREDTYPVLADRHGISEQGVKEFAVRNREAIEALVTEGRTNLAGLWSADRRSKLAELERIYEDCEAELADSVADDITTAHRIKFMQLQRAVLHDMSELSGDLTLRTKMEIDAPTLAAFAELVRGEDGNLYGVRPGRTPQD